MNIFGKDDVGKVQYPSDDNKIEKKEEQKSGELSGRDVKLSKPTSLLGKIKEIFSKPKSMSIKVESGTTNKISKPSQEKTEREQKIKDLSIKMEGVVKRYKERMITQGRFGADRWTLEQAKTELLKESHSYLMGKDPTMKPSKIDKEEYYELTDEMRNLINQRNQEEGKSPL